MLEASSPLSRLRASLMTGERTPLDVAKASLEAANGNASHNTYLSLDPEKVLRRAAVLQEREQQCATLPPLFSVPLSLKDCFDLAGTVTTCGSRFYARRDAAMVDSTMAQRLIDAGALLIGKTHLHPLAYGITGENPGYGDCVQPRDASLLTGGSSSGAAASVQEGSALAAIGTDTGGSIRVPAALCGLVGYRTSHTRAGISLEDAWAGGAHLAPSFDTLGVLTRDPRDLPLLAHALFSVPLHSPESLRGLRIGCIPQTFLVDSEAEILRAFSKWKQVLTAAGAEMVEMDVSFWEDALEIFAGIQAHEAAGLHQGHFDHFEAAIRDRLQWGASLSASILASLQQRLHIFRWQMQSLFSGVSIMMLPCAPVARLAAGADLSQARRLILRYTTPFSLAGLPVISMPGEMVGAPLGTGVQIAMPAEEDARLLALAALLGEQLAAAEVESSASRG